MIFICKYWHTLVAVGDSLTDVELTEIKLRPEGRLKYPSRILLNYSGYIALQTSAHQTVVRWTFPACLVFHSSPGASICTSLDRSIVIAPLLFLTSITNNLVFILA